MLTAERLQERQAGVGGSDVGAILNQNKYRSPLDVYLEKIGEKEPDDLSDNAAVEWGNRLEAVVAEKFSDDTGLKVRRDNRLLVGSEPFMLANIDRAIVGKAMGVKAGLECKTASLQYTRSEDWGPGAQFARDGESFHVVESDDRVPNSYLLQCAWYMAITDADLWFLAVLIGGNDFRTYTIHRNRTLEKLMLQKVSDFWRGNVLERNPPPPSNLADLETLYAQDNGLAIEANGETIELYEKAKLIQAQIKALEVELEGTMIGRTRIGGLKNKLRELIGEHAEILLGDEGKPLATWKTSKPRKVFDLDAFKEAHPKLHREFMVERPGTRALLLK